MTIIRNWNSTFGMIICSCNVLSERCIDGAIESGARRMSEVYACLGCAPQCGRCARSIRERLKAGTNEPALIQHRQSLGRVVSLVPDSEEGDHALR